MRAAILNEPFKLEIEEYELRKPRRNEIIVNVNICGLCGTDYHIYRGESYSKPPLIPGHEFVGTIVEKGDQVTGLQIGDRVAIDPNIYCGECQFCRNGKINFCENLKALGVSLNGGFAEYSLVPSSQAFLLSKEISFEAAAFAEPLSCCIRGIDQAEIKHGETVAIVGGGTVGLLMLQLAKMSGASKVVVIEPVKEKRDMAIQIGADFIFDPNIHDMLNEISELTTGGPDVVIECAGNSAAVNTAASLPKRGGRVIIFGLSSKKETVNINLQDFFLKELSIIGSLLNPFTFSRSVELLVGGKINTAGLNPVISNLENLSSILSQPRNSSVIKYHIKPN